MLYVETLDHSPAAVELERLPDGTAWLRLHKDIAEKKTEAPDPNEEGGTAYTATTAVCKLGTDRATETVESIAGKFDDWWTYAAAWEDQPPMTVAQRLDAVETAIADMAELVIGGTDA